jgi:hypothetical protein
MSSVEKFLAGVIAIALVATLVMNGSNTAKAVTGFGTATSGVLKTAEGR